MKICVIPIDNRPVCYNLIKDIADIDGNIELYMPDRKLLGDLTRNADTEKIFEWLKSLPPVDKIVIALDTTAYGGLIPSRRSNLSFEQIKEKTENLKEILLSKNAEIHAFSSIMRISNNNVNQEEKEYWKDYGTKIFNYSYNLHKDGHANTDVPKEILEDYLNTRKRNFEINKLYLEWQKQGIFKTLIFSKDDCAQYGLNVQEAQELEKLGGFTKTGADEIPLSLFARAINKKVKISPIFIEDDQKHLISNYEDISIEKSVLSQIELAGMEVSNEENADMVLIINNFRNNQGEIVMKKDTEPFNKILELPQKPYAIADVRFANGADNKFVEELFKDFSKNNIDDKTFYGYSAWNTSANTLGSLLCALKVKYMAKNYNEKAFKKLQLIRFSDDWAYQANVRQNLKTTKITDDMKLFESRLKEIFNTDFKAEYSFPWNRLFEIEVSIEFN
ncbi:DUF4127 family protein [bacterium]|nr:DUF4127 family protein [bacterium]